jgi:Uma2 family endonuclease
MRLPFPSVSDDLVAKFNRYAAWGARDYWIVDPRDKVLLTFRSESGIFSESGRHTDGRVNLGYADIRVELDLDDLWA